MVLYSRTEAEEASLKKCCSGLHQFNLQFAVIVLSLVGIAVTGNGFTQIR